MNTKLIASMMVLPLALGAASAQAGCKCQREDLPVVLEAIVVTPGGAYSVSEWEDRREQKALAAAEPTVLPTLVITPDREQAEARAPASASARGFGSARVSGAPDLTHRPSLLDFVSRLFN